MVVGVEQSLKLLRNVTSKGFLMQVPHLYQSRWFHTLNRMC